MFHSSEFDYPIPLDKLVSYYKFIDNVNDSFGSKHLEVNKTLSFEEGIIDKTFLRIEAQTKLKATSNNDFSFVENGFDTPFSINFFYRPFNYDYGALQYKTLLSRSISDSMRQIELGYYKPASSVIHAYIKIWTDNSNYLYIQGKSNIFTADRDFYESLTFTYDGSGLASGISIYWKGVKEKTLDYSYGNYEGMTLLETRTHFTSSIYSTQNLTLMYFDEIQVWNDVLSGKEIKQIFKNQMKGMPLL